MSIRTITTFELPILILKFHKITMIDDCFYFEKYFIKVFKQNISLLKDAVLTYKFPIKVKMSYQ